jgi:hypothetical protein
MDRPFPSPGSVAGQSLVGTLLALGLLLAMITTGLTLMAATEARHVPVAELQVDPLVERRCPVDVLAEDGASSKRVCLTLNVQNVGAVEALTRCEITGVPSGMEARFHANHVHVYSPRIAAGAAESLLVHIDGAGTNAPIGATCDVVSPRPS